MQAIERSYHFIKSNLECRGVWYVCGVLVCGVCMVCMCGTMYVVYVCSVCMVSVWYVCMV